MNAGIVFGFIVGLVLLAWYRRSLREYAAAQWQAELANMEPLHRDYGPPRSDDRGWPWCSYPGPCSCDVCDYYSVWPTRISSKLSDV